MRNVLIIILLLSAILLQAKILIIPENYQTIQQAVDSATKGDTLIVKPGIYKEKIVIKDKNLLITSKFFLAHDKKYISNTILDGKGENCVISFDNCPIGTQLIGFSIINGYSNIGGGISINKSDVEIENINLIQNTAEVKGGGLYAFKSTLNIIDSNISKNSAIGVGGGGGGLLLEYSKFSAVNLKIVDNLAFFGGGAYLMRSDIQLKNINVKNNKAESKAGGIYFLNCKNGIIKNVNIIENSAFKEGGEAGGICLDTSDLMMVNVKISNNIAYKAGGAYLIFSNSKLINCLIDNNMAKDKCGALFLYSSKPILQNCTIVDNKAGQVGGIYSSGTSNPIIENSIIWNNKEDISVDYTSDYTLKYTLIKGNYHGKFLYKKDPIFVDYKNHNYHLNKTSFGFNMGNPLKKYNDRDGSRNDLGCYGGKFGKW